MVAPMVMGKINHLPPDKSGVLLLKKEEKYIVLYINTFPSFIRRGVMPEGS
jgi:hypothetical protein